MNVKRIEWVDIAKAICAFFVILHHLETNTQLLSKYYMPFFLNGFLFLSGYIYKQQDFKTFINKKFFSLIVPWFFFGLLIIITGNIYSPSPEAHNGLFIDMLCFFAQIRELNDAMWFVAALFISYIPFYFIIKYTNSKRKKTHFLVFVFLVAIYCLEIIYESSSICFPWGNNKLPWHIEYIPNALLFMYFGYIYRNEIEQKYKNSTLLTLLILLVYVILVNIFENYYMIILQIMIELYSVVLLVQISKIISPNMIIQIIGQNSLIYFGIAHYLNVPAQMLISTFFPAIYAVILSNQYYSAIFSLVFSVISCLILLLPAKIINDYFPFVLGKH